jgi:hypothetical protein
MLNVIYEECRKEGHYALCHYAECRYAECRGAGSKPDYFSSADLGPFSRHLI